ncbi:flagellar export chaperone FliS [Laribacter hongkongensis]|nr:flagellar export chaperone FliS [Laribacter hongkongensis]MCG9080780.1 flagellar export chaperone FliS [Laribacter hongkongensis]
MTRQFQQFARAYTNDALEARVLGANPAELVEMLYAGAVSALRNAVVAMHQKDYARKTECIGKAMDILNSLDSALNHEKGGDISQSLSALYGYCLKTVCEANVENSEDKFEAVINVLLPLREAWEELGRQQRVASAGSGRGHGSITA